MLHWKVCAMAGYMSFLIPIWIPLLIAWNRSSGSELEMMDGCADYF